MPSGLPHRSSDRPGASARQRWRLGLLLIGLTLAGLLTWLWQKTRSLSVEEYARTDSALRELHSLDRTINQDVLRARYQLIPSFDPVRRSYRRIEELEEQLAVAPLYLDEASRPRLVAAVANYRASITAKQELIEEFKYRSTDLKELLAYLPGAGTGVATAAAESGDDPLAASVNRVLQQTLFYNLTSDERYAPLIQDQVTALGISGSHARTHAVTRRVRTLVQNITTLLKVKPQVDQLLLRIFAAPVNDNQEKIASIYDAGYAAAERGAGRYRITLYGVSVALLLLVAYSVRRLQQTAHALTASNERLEDRVIERTQALDDRNDQLRTVLDNVEQALFTVDLDGRLSAERSAALDRWFPHAIAGAHLWSVLEPIDGHAALWCALGWDQLREGVLPVELALAQLPARIVFRDHHYQIGYRPIRDGGAGHDLSNATLEGVMVVISDVTEAVARARVEVDQQEQLAIFREIMRDRPAFLEFFAECERLVDLVARSAPTDRPEAHAATFRAVHTLKASVSMCGLSSLTTLCHELEARMVDTGEGLSAADRGHLGAGWSTFAARVRLLTGSARSEPVELARSDLQSLRAEIIAGSGKNQLLRRLRDLEREPAGRRLERVRDEATALMQRLGRGEVQVILDVEGDVRFDRQRWAPFWSAFTHMIRNSLDHGLELPAERLAVGKSAEGRLWVRAKQGEGRVIIEIADDGRGLDWEALRTQAQRLGLPSDTDEQLRQVLFRGGVSTSATVTELSGRGIGVSACHQACLALGGRVEVLTTRGQGTTFRFEVPDAEEAVASGGVSLTPAA